MVIYALHNKQKLKKLKEKQKKSAFCLISRNQYIIYITKKIKKCKQLVHLFLKLSYQIQNMKDIMQYL